MKNTTAKIKFIKYGFFLLLGVIALGIVIFYISMRLALAPMDGDLKLSGLKAPVKVTRDTYGVPHIEAENREDVFRALGFVVASERLFQMEVSRRLANGELAEIVGKALVNSDVLFRTLGLRYHAQKLYDEKLQKNELSPEMLKEINAFYDGVNQYVKRGRLPIEFKILGVSPKPFSVIDGYAFLGVMSYSFGIAPIQEPLLTKFRTRFGADLIQEMRNLPKEASGHTQVVYNGSGAVLLETMKTLELGYPLFEGSNGWLVAKNRSASGFPILANDPHITYAHPGVWFEAHLKTPDYESYGHFLPLIPYPVHAHNRQRGWGFTMSLNDDMDLYQEQIDEKNKTYKFKNKDLPYSERAEVISVKGEAERKLMVKSTHHGPILNHVLDMNNIALSWSHYSKDNDMMSDLYRLGMARSMQEFKTVATGGKAPGLNVLYADKENIAWWTYGEITLKPKHVDADYILDGASGADEPLGVLAINKKPFSENPVNGIIVSANSKPDSYPEGLRGDWQPKDRYDTLDQIFAQKEKWTIPEMMEIQSLNMNFETKKIVAKILESIAGDTYWEKDPQKKYIDSLKTWDYISRADAVAPLIYYSWLNMMSRRLLRDISDKEFESFVRLPSSPLFIRRILFNQNSPWWKENDRKEFFRLSFEMTIKFLTEKIGPDQASWNWGKLHRFELIHPLGKVSPLNYIFNIGPYPSGGGNQEINNMRYNPNFLITSGPSVRRLVDFASPEKGWGILPAGNSGHILSPFYKDQLKMFLDGKYREEWLDSEDIAKYATHKMILLPN